jgi:hypothetical protein
MNCDQPATGLRRPAQRERNEMTSTLDLQQLRERLGCEQQGIHREVEAWRTWWKEIREWGVPNFGQMSQRLRNIRDHLDEHFQHEERNGCLAQAGKLGKDLARSAEHLVKEHAELLTELNSLIGRLESSGSEPLCWGDARRDFEAFLERLTHHEDAEDQLIRDALGSAAR